MKFAVVVSFALATLLAGCGRSTPESTFALASKAEHDARASADTMKSLEKVIASYKSAAEQYEKVINEFPASAQAESSMFNIAQIRNNDTHETALAVEAYKKYAEKYPSSVRSESALFLVGFLYNNELRDTVSAGAAYRNFLQKYPDGEMAVSARYELMTLGKSPEEILSEKNVAAAPEVKPAAKKPRR